jgi:signal transduction histidine kinase
MLNREAALPIFRLRAVLDSLRTLDSISTFSLVRTFPPSALAVLAAIIYYAASQIGFLMTPAGSPISTFWPPNAILLAILLLTPLRIWWLILLAVLPAHLFIQLRTDIPLMSSLGWYVGNCGEALLGAACIRACKKGKPLFNSLSGVTLFLAAGVLFPVLVTSFIDAGGVVITGLGQNYWTLWATRLTSNLVADLTIVPIIVIVETEGLSWFRRANLTTHFGLAALALATMFSTVLAFGRVDITVNVPAVLYLPLICILWGALQFGLAAVCASSLAIAVIAGWNAVHHHGPYAVQSTVQGILSRQVLLIAFTIPCILLAALLSERRRMNQDLRSARLNLIGARERERSRLARTLRCDVVESLILVGLDVDKLRKSAYSGKPEFDVVWNRIAEISAATLDLSHSLHPFILEYLGLSRAIAKLCHDVALRSGISIHFSEPMLAYSLSVDISQRLFRITQEALNNILERNEAMSVNIELKVIGPLAVLRVSDDALTIPAVGKDGSNGLSYIREQVLAHQGTFEIVTSSSGSFLEICLPIGTTSR